MGAEELLATAETTPIRVNALHNEPPLPLARADYGKRSKQPDTSALFLVAPLKDAVLLRLC